MTVQLNRGLKVPKKKRREKPKEEGHPHRKVFSVLGLISLFLISYGVWQYAQPSTELNSPASLFTLTDTDFSDFMGRAVVLDFFATWCSPCIEEIPQLAEIHEKYNSNDVVVISISSPTDNVETLKQFRIEHNMDWRVAKDTIGVFDKYGIQYIPTLIILDKEGVIRYKNVGLTSASVLSSKIDSLLSD
jgi:thiol-disulfide isomerase/thioredoxin